MSLRVFLGLGVALALAGCETPSVRAHRRPGAFTRLTTADQRTVLAGKVHVGMLAEAVYIAWGEPDAKRPSGDGKAPSETWLYRRQLTLKTPMDSFDRWPAGNRVFGQVVPLVVNSGLGFGGVGNEGVTLYQPHLVFSDDTVRRAVFEDGRLARYEEFQAGDAPVHRLTSAGGGCSFASPWPTAPSLPSSTFWTKRANCAASPRRSPPNSKSPRSPTAK